MSAYYKFIAGLFLLLIGIDAPYSQQISNEYQVKAAFIYHLIRMVEWPEKNPHPTRPLTLCFIGQDSFGKTIDSIKDKKVNNRSLVFKKGIRQDEIDQCHLLFIDSSEKERLDSILASIRHIPVLTVGDVEKFTDQGGMINLLKVSNRIQIEVNLKSVKRAKLIISSRLLAIAKILEQ